MLSPSQHGFQLLKKSLSLLKPIKHFLFLSALCSLLDLAILGAILTPLHRFEMLQQPLTTLQWEHFAFFLLLYLLFLYITHLIFFFSHATLMNAMNLKISGKKPSLLCALKMTFRRYPYIFLWISFASTLGFIWAFSKSKRLGEQSWPMAIYFVLPVLLEENLKPFQAISRSSELITKTWGENLRPRFQSIGILFMFLFIALIPGFIGFIIGGKIAFILGTLSGMLIFILGIFYISARTLLLWNLYQFARGRKIPEGQDIKLFENAFMQMKKI